LYKNHAPEGCTTLTCLLIGDSYNYWKKAKEDGSYKDKKQELANEFIARLSELIPEIKDNVEVTDVATPLTYERYCKSYEGSWLSVWEPGGKSINYPIKCASVNGLYFASQRSMMPGGLPIAVCAGRTAAQLLCKDTNTWFN
jgi:phytoene dehydrogenase-like protein